MTFFERSKQLPCGFFSRSKGFQVPACLPGGVCPGLQPQALQQLMAQTAARRAPLQACFGAAEDGAPEEDCAEIDHSSER